MVLHLGQKAQYWLSSVWLCGCAERNLEVLVGNELRSSQQNAAAVKKANQTPEHC